jgi:DNA-damage-inducible protein D
MANELSKQHTTLFESIKEIDASGNEYWGARKLSKVLEYSEFRHFLPVIERAKEACANSGHSVADHFEDYLEEIVQPKPLKARKKKN